MEEEGLLPSSPLPFHSIKVLVNKNVEKTSLVVGASLPPSLYTHPPLLVVLSDRRRRRRSWLSLSPVSTTHTHFCAVVGGERKTLTKAAASAALQSGNFSHEMGSLNNLCVCLSLWTPIPCLGPREEKRAEK